MLAEEYRSEASRRLGEDVSLEDSSGYWFRQSVQFIKREPQEWVRLLCKKFVLFWNKMEIPSNTDFGFYLERFHTQYLKTISFGLVAPLGIIGMIWCYRRSFMTRVIGSYVLTYMVAVVLFFVLSEYRLAIMPALFIFAGGAISKVLVMVRKQRRVQLAVSLLLLTGACTFVDLPQFQSDRAVWYYNLGNRYRDTGMIEKAEDMYRSALRINPKHADTRYNLAMLFIRRGQKQEAMKLLTSLMKEDAKDPMVRANLAWIYYEQGRYKDAITLLEQIRDYEMEHQAMVWYYLGRCYQKVNRLEDAARDFQGAIDKGEKGWQGYYHLGEVLAELGNSQGAINALEHAETLAPRDAKNLLSQELSVLYKRRSQQ